MSTSTLPPRLRAYPLPAYLEHGTEAWRQHIWASTSRQCRGHRLSIHALADAVWEYARATGPINPCDAYARDIAVQMLTTLGELLNLDRGGWDGGTVSAWAHDVADYLDVKDDL